jgi:hypothetical protein
MRGFEFGFLILAFNGLLTFLGLVVLSDFGDFQPIEEIGGDGSGIEG